MLRHNLSCMSITRNLTKLFRTWQDHRRTLRTARSRIFSPARPHHMDLTALGRNRPGPAPPRPARPCTLRLHSPGTERARHGPARPDPARPEPAQHTPRTHRTPLGSAHHQEASITSAGKVHMARV